ncbi:MAG: UPF0182 family protein [Labilithrix sp.]|nr:UPF0182 family protein [Labilithrix sp.]
MDTVALLVLLALAMAVLVRGIRRKSWLAILVGLGAAAATLVVFGSFSTWGEMLWLDVGAALPRAWLVVAGTAGVALAAALLSAALVALVTFPARRGARRARRIGVALAALAGAAWGAASWSLVLRWTAGGSSGRRGPGLGRDPSVYLFSLPLVDAAFSLLLLLVVISAIVTARAAREPPARRLSVGGSPR